MLYGTVPFKANNMTELQKMIIKANYTLKDDISEEARDLLRRLLERDPIKRITISEVLEHAWLEGSEVQSKGSLRTALVPLFNQQEKDYIRNEFSYNDSERYNRNETDPFTDHHLDSTQNSMVKNATTKSVILAPFNSTRSDIDVASP